MISIEKVRFHLTLINRIECGKADGVRAAPPKSVCCPISETLQRETMSRANHASRTKRPFRNIETRHCVRWNTKQIVLILMDDELSRMTHKRNWFRHAILFIHQSSLNLSHLNGEFKRKKKYSLRIELGTILLSFAPEGNGIFTSVDLHNSNII